MNMKLSKLKSKHLKLLAFLTDIIHAIVTQIIALSQSADPSEAASDVAVAFFAIFGALYVILGIAYLLRFIRSDNCCQGIREHVQDIHIFFAGFWYYFSDNFAGLVRDHGANLGFSQDMIDAVLDIQPILIVVVLALYRAETFHLYGKRQYRQGDRETVAGRQESREGTGAVIELTELNDGKQEDRETAAEVEPTASNDDTRENVQQEGEIVSKSKDNNHGILHIEVIELLVFVIEFDALFTVAQITAERSSGCPRVVIAFIWLLYAFLLVVCFSMTTGSIIVFFRKLKNRQWHHIVANYIIAVFICLCFGFYLLGDNALPLACAGGNGRGITIVRLVFLLLTGVICVTLIVIRVCKAK